MTTWDQFVQSATKVAKEHGFPLGVLLGQAALETGRGKSSQSQSKNNWFGLGAFDANPNNAFGFKNAEESIKYYINLIKNDPRYKNAWAARNDPVKMIQEIKKSGYATDPDYVGKVTSTPEFKNNAKATKAVAGASTSTLSDPKFTEFVRQQRAEGSQLPVSRLEAIYQYGTGKSKSLQQPKKTGFLDNLIPQAYAEEMTPLSNYSKASGGTGYAPPPQPQANMYTVKPGDTLWGIAQNYLGNGANWQQLGYQGDPKRLQIGSQIRLPQAKQATAQNYSPAPQANTAGQSGQLDFRPTPSKTSATLSSYQAPPKITPIKTVPTQQLPKKTNFSGINFNMGNNSQGYF